MTKKILMILLALVLGGALLWVRPAPRVSAEEDFSSQVGRILKNQEKMLQDLQEIKAELKKIRFRAN
ncbi:MAG: hypothetical protein HY590_02525 [Candidatus Omnitrophica bacterium]|nr:hypothetical protein [Candidatus Omnitrophota bacterium]